MQKTLKLIFRSLFTLLCILVVMWVIGYALFFAYTLNLTPTKPIQKSDSIIVLTGGTSRIETGFDLLLKQQAPSLYISGTHTNTDLPDLLEKSDNLSQADAAQLMKHCCITLDDIAQSTRSNAIEASRWITQNKLQSVILVTSNYHMPRALFEFRRFLPDLSIIPYPVSPRDVPIFSTERIQVTYTEYNKFIVIGGLYVFDLLKKKESSQ